MTNNPIPAALASIKLNWFTGFPQHEGLFAVRGWSLDDPSCVAYVQVRMFREELVCNLHCETSERNMRQWSLVRRFTATGFEWADVLATLPPPADGAVAWRWKFNDGSRSEWARIEVAPGITPSNTEIEYAYAAPPADSAMELLRESDKALSSVLAAIKHESFEYVNGRDLHELQSNIRTLLAGRK